MESDDLISLLLERGYATVKSPELNSNNKRHVLLQIKKLVHWKHQVAIEKMLADIAMQKKTLPTNQVVTVLLEG